MKAVILALSVIFLNGTVLASEAPETTMNFGSANSSVIDKSPVNNHPGSTIKFIETENEEKTGPVCENCNHEEKHSEKERDGK